VRVGATDDDFRGMGAFDTAVDEDAEVDSEEVAEEQEDEEGAAVEDEDEEVEAEEVDEEDEAT